MKTKNIKVVYTYRHHQSGGILHSGTGPCTAVPKIQEKKEKNKRNKK